MTVVLWLVLGCGWGDSVPCEEPEPLRTEAGESLGYTECDDGTILRTEPSTPVVVGSWEPCQGDEVERFCEADSDCGGNLSCLSTPGYDTGPACECRSACLGDSDCGSGEVCLGSGVVFGFPDYPRCIPAECTSNSDCASGECSLSAESGWCAERAWLACRDPEADACRTNFDCDNGDCQYAPEEGCLTCSLTRSAHRRAPDLGAGSVCCCHEANL